MIAALAYVAFFSLCWACLYRDAAISTSAVPASGFGVSGPLGLPGRVPFRLRDQLLLLLVCRCSRLYSRHRALGSLIARWLLRSYAESSRPDQGLTFYIV